jgi:hypothetical protein
VEHQDKILSLLCSNLTDRKLLKVTYFSSPVPDALLEQKRSEICNKLNITAEEASYLVFSGETENRTYNSLDEHIHILFKDGSIRDISQVDNALINQTLFDTVKKFYICYLR